MLYLLYSSFVGIEDVYMLPGSSLCFQGVREWNSEFLSLFPHRFDYIFAKHPELHESPVWQTESRYPLSDRLIQQGSYLYGVRFGAETQYCLLDIDASSRYHPGQDPWAIARILAALEPLGLVAYLVCTSSYSGGIHLYLPFQQAQKTWQLAIALQTLLENAGFKPTLGQLELFPNAKLFSSEGTPSLYAAHRLPLQAGFYLLNQNWEPIYTSEAGFFQQWQFAQQRNAIDAKTLQQVIKTAHRQRYYLSGKADKFLNDLNAEIEPGWSAHGQTNYLLGRIALRSYIFGHLLFASRPLEGKALVDNIVQTAKSLPGYQDWCRHQHEIEQRAEEWALCVENSRYFRFGYGKKKLATSEGADAETPDWNQQQLESARARIRSAIADLLNRGSLPSAATARFQAITRYGIGGSTLYRHRDLWHPAYLVENPPHPPTAENTTEVDGDQSASTSVSDTSLLAPLDRNAPLDKDFSHFQKPHPVQIGRNPEASWGRDSSNSPVAASVNSETPASAMEKPAESGVLRGIRYVQQVLFEVKERLTTQRQRTSTPRPTERDELAKPVNLAQVDSAQVDSAQLQRMQQYLASGDPILMAEAQRCLASNSVSSQQVVCSLSTHPVNQSGNQSGNQLVLPGVCTAQSQKWVEDAIAERSADLSADRSIADLSIADLSIADLSIADLSDVLAQIDIYRQCLGWTAEQVGSTLQQLFGKSHQALLTDSELTEWCHWLRDCINPKRC